VGDNVVLLLLLLLLLLLGAFVMMVVGKAMAIPNEASRLKAGPSM